MKAIVALVMLPLLASAVRMEQILMEEPGQTNRSASAWAAAHTPIISDVATAEYLRTLVATSIYSVGIAEAPVVLSASTERFSTNWSYAFVRGGGIAVSNLTVRDTLTSSAAQLLVSNLNSRFAWVTNSGNYGNIVATDATLRGSSFTAEDLSSSVTVDTEVNAGVLVTEELSPTGGVLTINSPAVYFAREPVFTEASDIYSSTNYESSSSFASLGTFNLGKYSEGLMWLTTTNMGLRQVSELQSVGMDVVSQNVNYDVGNGLTAPASWSCVPVMTTQYDSSDAYFTTGFWEYSQESVAAAYDSITSAVTSIFIELGTGSVYSVAGYTNAALMNAAGPSPALRIQVESWYKSLPSTTNYAGAVIAASNYVAAVDTMFAQLRGEGSVCVVDRFVGNYVSYTRYKQTLPRANAIYRVTMQLHLTGDIGFSDTSARYWLMMNGVRRLMHTVSSGGESGAAFTFIGKTGETPGYLYLDLSEFAKINSSVLNSTWYYVKLELLRGFSPCQK